MKKAAVLFITLIMFIDLQSGASAEPPPVGSEGRPGDCRRIVSLAPSITEILFSLGLGDRVVGVTRYCTYPAAALTKAKVGGYYDPDYEKILRLKPDLVIMLVEHATAKHCLRNFHINILQVDHNTIGDIVQSIKIIGDTCGSTHAADSIVAVIKLTIERIRGKTVNIRRPRVMVSVGRSMGAVGGLCIAGTGTYYDEMIRLAGGENAFARKSIAFPIISPEGICRINPEIIIDMVPESGEKRVDDRVILARWTKIGRIDAVRNGRVYLFRQDFAQIPGPRFIIILQQMAKVIHPELTW